MTARRLFLLAATPAMAAAALAACSQQAAEDAAPAIAVSDGWVRATPGGNDVTAAYFTLTNSGGSDRFLGAGGDALDRVELHRSFQDDSGVMRMEHTPALDIPGGEAVRLAPGSYHLMLYGAADLSLGDTLCLVLDFERADSRIACLPVLDEAPQ